jgi:hypothetical protein
VTLDRQRPAAPITHTTTRQEPRSARQMRLPRVHQAAQIDLLRRTGLNVPDLYRPRAAARSGRAWRLLTDTPLPGRDQDRLRGMPPMPWGLGWLGAPTWERSGTQPPPVVLQAYAGMRREDCTAAAEKEAARCALALCVSPSLVTARGRERSDCQLPPPDSWTSATGDRSDSSRSTSVTGLASR